MAVTVPAWLPEKVCWALSDEYHAPFVAGRPRPHLHRARAALGRCAPPASSPAASHHAHALHSPYWWLRCAVGPDQRRPPAGQGVPPAAGVGHRDGRRSSPAGPSGCSTPCSARAWSSTPRKPVRGHGGGACRRDRTVGRRHRSPPTQLQADRSTPSPSGSCPTGMIPWFPGGHADPWNHVEAAMALALGGRRARGRAGLRVAGRHASGPTARGTSTTWPTGSSRTSSTPTRSPTSPPASGTTGCSPSDRGFLETHVAGRRPGHRVRARPADRRGARSSGPATPTARRGRSRCSPARRSICHSLRCAIALAAAPRPRAPRLGAVRRPAWPTSSAHEPDAFAPKHRWAMDWYYPVLAGVLDRRRRPRAARPHALDAFVMEGRGVRCVSDRPWVTAAETCECALAHLAVGERDTAAELFGWAQQYRERRTAATGPASCTPSEVHFPGGERSTYTAAAVVLAADALVRRRRPASGLFVDHDAVLPERPSTDHRATSPRWLDPRRAEPPRVGVAEMPSGHAAQDAQGAGRR